VKPCSNRTEGSTLESNDANVGANDVVEDVAGESEFEGWKGVAKVSVGFGVERYKRGPESGRKLLRGFSA